MKAGTGHSSSFFSEKFSHLNIDKVCHRQALFVFLPLLLLHISSHALTLSPVSVPPFFLPSPIFEPRRQLCSKSRGLSREKRRVLGKSPQVLKRNKRRKSATRRFRSVILPPPTFTVVIRCETALYLRNPTHYSPPAPHNSDHVPHATRHAFQLPFLRSPFTSSLCPFDARTRAILQKKVHLCITFCPILHKRWGVR